MKIFILYEGYYDDYLDSGQEKIEKVFHAKTYKDGHDKINQYLSKKIGIEYYLAEDGGVYPRYYIEELESE